MDDHHVVQVECCVRVDRYLRKVMPGITQSLIEKLLRQGKILLNDTKVKACTRVSGGEVIHIRYAGGVFTSENNYSNIHCDKLLQLVNKSVVYEDEDVIALSKPAGVHVQGGSKVRVSISDVLTNIRPGEDCRIVHRLDKDTSGVLLLARNLRVARLISKEFQERRIEKKYLAVTDGVPPTAIGEICDPIFYKKSAEVKEKQAKTLFSVVKRLSDAIALVELCPVTGRKHQLRIHLSKIGCPVVGDRRYGIGSVCTNLHLHAHSVKIKLMGRELAIVAPLPDYMEEKIRACALHNVAQQMVG